jgi:hypothetical protein
MRMYPFWASFIQLCVVLSSDSVVIIVGFITLISNTYILPQYIATKHIAD